MENMTDLEIISRPNGSTIKKKRKRDKKRWQKEIKKRIKKRLKKGLKTEDMILLILLTNNH